ncbi:HalOD1 output domain-containing protein [Natrinema halophilum]|uniref:Halobacterial output domain-containing protein n=1 Tax=Natrinema halophilum TaxID=1699371 RepID=A0A7D5GSJ2_9EURY|nr:HalOD1 output domain-containing protein [Natrinema halophilum]QLG48766.1 hypothetical protein HYG82_07860 [Natrinema halophilum]
MSEKVTSPPSTSGYTQIGERTVRKVAASVGTSATALPPLYGEIDPDALERLFGGREDNPGRLEFRYVNHHVVVRSNGTITVSPIDDLEPADPDGTVLAWGGDRPLCLSIVEAVAATTDDEPTAMEPLYDVVDPEALEDIVSQAPPQNGGTIAAQFQYSGCVVSVAATGSIHIDVACETLYN